MQTFQNEKAYPGLKAAARKVVVVLEVALDPVPGWGDNVGDHLTKIFQNPYVLSATFQGE
jgi:hypothetical protein